MAARTRRILLHEEHRQKIQTTQLINRLQDCGLGKIDLTPTQISAITALLKKSLPDLSAVELSGDSEDGGLTVNIVRYAVDKPA